MIKALLCWFGLTIGVSLGIMQVRRMNKLAVWSMFKTLAYAAVCSLIAIFVLTLIVVLF